MREIKYRAWDKEDKIMHNDAEVGSINGLKFYELIESKRYEIIQFTELHDKNEEEMYDDDIIKKPDFKTKKNKTVKPRKYIIKYKEGGYFAEEINGNGFFHLSMAVKEYEIIGNAHKNPELLK